MNPEIIFDSVSFKYEGESRPGRPVLDKVSLEIKCGEFIAIVGSNGSGKSTLLKLINGLLLPQSGRVIVRGLPTDEKKNWRAIRQHVGMVFQFPEDQIVASTVAEDVAFGPENLGLPPDEIRRRIQDSLALTGLKEHSDRPPYLLSGGQTQRLALAGVLAMRPSVVLFDEATTMLDPAGRRMALEWMRRLHTEGMTVIFITHHMEEAAQAGRVIILHEGKVVRDGTPRQIFIDSKTLSRYGLGLPRPARYHDRFEKWFGKFPVLPLHTLDWLENLPIPEPYQVHDHPSQTRLKNPHEETPFIEVKDLEHIYLAETPLAYQSLKGVNFSGHHHSITGLLGQTGSGKSTLLQHLNGLLKPQKGFVRVGSFLMDNPKFSTREIARFVSMVFQNPENQFFEQYVGDEISYGPRQTGCDEPLSDRVRWAMNLVGLNFEAFKDRFVSNLSGGERRKVALAAALALKPEILLLDEPTAGLDPASHLDILNRLSELKTGGMTIVLSSHRMNDLAALTQRLAVFQNGKIILEGDTGEVFWDFEGLAEAGLEPPLIVQTVKKLQEMGWDLPRGIVTPDQLEQALSNGYQTRERVL